MSILKNLVNLSLIVLIIMSERYIAFLAERFGAEKDATDVRVLGSNAFT